MPIEFFSCAVATKEFQFLILHILSDTPRDLNRNSIILYSKLQIHLGATSYLYILLSGESPNIAFVDATITHFCVNSPVVGGVSKHLLRNIENVPSIIDSTHMFVP